MPGRTRSPCAPNLHELGWHRTGPDRDTFEKYSFIMEPTWYEAKAIKDGGLKVLIVSEANPALTEMGQQSWQEAVCETDKNGRVKAIECVKMRLTEELDESGRPIPEPIPGSEFTIEIDAAITALGQEADWSCLTPECACTLTEWGTMNVDPLTLQNDDPDIFAGGDAIRGPETVIQAIADGKQAAISIDRFIGGADLQEGRDKEWVAVTDVQKEKYDPAGRAQMPRLEPKVRLKSFDEVQQGLTEEMAVQEAQRCISCGCACIQACPYDVIQFNVEEGKSHKCDLCFDHTHRGELPVCVVVCLTDAFAFGEIELLRQNAADQGYSVVDVLSEESILYVK